MLFPLLQYRQAFVLCYAAGKGRRSERLCGDHLWPLLLLSQTLLTNRSNPLLWIWPERASDWLTLFSVQRLLARAASLHCVAYANKSQLPVSPRPSPPPSSSFPQSQGGFSFFFPLRGRSASCSAPWSRRTRCGKCCGRLARSPATPRRTSLRSLFALSLLSRSPAPSCTRFFCLAVCADCSRSKRRPTPLAVSAVALQIRLALFCSPPSTPSLSHTRFLS